MRKRWFIPPLTLLLASCGWSRFDDVSKNTPVVLLNKPGALKAGFGVTVATASFGGRTRVIVGGANGQHPAAVFDLGSGTSPAVDAIDTGSCTQDSKCSLGDELAGLGNANVGDTEPDQYCFMLGVGETSEVNEYGITGRCADATEYTLPVPADVLSKDIKGDLLFQETLPPPPLVFATDKGESPALAAGAKAHAFAWFYKPLSRQPVELVPPGTRDTDFGAAVAVLRLGTDGDAGASNAARRIIAVGAPTAGHVWLFDGESGAPVGCLGGVASFGMTLASGRVDTDAFDDLVVADGTNVTVFSGASFAALGAASDVACSLAALPAGAVIASFGCGSRDDVTGCPGGFGTALDVGDLDGDGDGEVLVGAPGMTVRGTSRAGAVLVYDAEGKDPTFLTDQLFLSSAKSGDGLGQSLVAAHITGRDVVVAGAPGNGNAAVFYCSTLLGGAAGGGRCQ